MKKLLCFCIVVVIFSLTGCSAFFAEKEQETLIASQENPDGNYVICLYQVGEPRWSFGPVDAKLVLKDAGGNVLDEESFNLFNDGAGVHEGNLKLITWLGNKVEIIMDADERPEECYVLNYS